MDFTWKNIFSKILLQNTERNSVLVLFLQTFSVSLSPLLHEFTRTPALFRSLPVSRCIFRFHSCLYFRWAPGIRRLTTRLTGSRHLSHDISVGHRLSDHKKRHALACQRAIRTRGGGVWWKYRAMTVKCRSSATRNSKGHAFARWRRKRKRGRKFARVVASPAGKLYNERKSVL